jgi:hypothetical protein
VLQSLNKDGALLRLIRRRWIGLAAVQCAMLWSIPQIGPDLPPSAPVASIPSPAAGQALTLLHESSRPPSRDPDAAALPFI